MIFAREALRPVRWATEAPLSDTDGTSKAHYSRHEAITIATVGLERVGAPHVRHLTSPLWEMRLSGRGRHRASTLCRREGSAGRGGAGVREETRRTPRREIEVALRRAGEVS